MTEPRGHAPATAGLPGGARTASRGARRSTRPIAGTTAAMVLLIGAFLLDCASGNEVSSSLFYVVGIAVAAWLVGQRTALVFAGLSVVAWGTAVRVVGPGFSQPPLFSKPSVFYWNLGAELAIYAIAAVALARIRRGLLHERQLVERLNLANDALDRETRAVGDLQREMLPAACPEVRGYEWQVFYATSTHAGGDYYDFFRLPDGQIGVLLSDASGHGAQATVLMAMVRVLLHTTSEALAPPDRVLGRLGRQLARTVEPGRFATACYVVLEPSSGRIDFSVAGHPPPLLLRADDEEPVALPMRGGPPLGLVSDAPVDTGTATIHPGDTLVLYTDGLTEGMSPTREMFGEGRLREALVRGGALPLADLRERVLRRLDAHRAGAALEDDVTLLMVRRAP
jgi:serine phosphatase RsbU (regulator of sigma subunit)